MSHFDGIITPISQVERKPSVVTVGTFDGVHKGHLSLINLVVERAKEKGCRTVVVTFDPHPREIVVKDGLGIELLSTVAERAQFLKELGIDLMVTIPFTREFSLTSSRGFIKDYIIDKIGLCEFVIGFDHQFGKDRSGGISTVQSLSEEYDFAVHVVDAKQVEDTTVSSTQIRTCLKNEGNVKLAANWMGRNYVVQGTVIHGDERGRTIGFPTANIMVNHPKKLMPKDGVYAVDVLVGEERHRGMLNIGKRPTFHSKIPHSMEVHIFDFSQMIYGYPISIEFLERIRDEKVFAGKDELTKQLKLDEIVAKSV